MTIAKTNLTLAARPGLVADADLAILDYMNLNMKSTEAEFVIQFAGRACYQSFDKSREATRANAN